MQFFVPFPEANFQTSLKAIDTTGTAPGTDLKSTISIVVGSSNTIVVYDQWEDGYENDINSPLQSTTQIWGDGNTNNGVAPGYANDILPEGAVIVLTNIVSLPRNSSLLRYDGRDRIGATKAIVVTRACWAVTPGTVLASATEVYDTTRYGTNFIIPVGVTTPPAQNFTYSSLYIVAAQNSTALLVDTNGDGTTDIATNINMGESFFVNGAVLAGATVKASAPVQVHELTGRIGSTYQSRTYAIRPYNQWDTSYYAPVGTTLSTEVHNVFVYNPYATNITVLYSTKTGSGSFTVTNKSANAPTYRFPMPLNSGAHFYNTNGATFYAVGANDSGAAAAANQTHDWGYALVPESALTTEAIVGWGPGADDQDTTPGPDGNGSPVWVTPIKATTLYVNYSGNYASNYPSGVNGTINGRKYDAVFTLAAYQSQTVSNATTKSMTGARLFTADGTTFAAAWGENPLTAGPGNPYMDLGTTIIPFPVPKITKSTRLYNDVNGDGIINWGDTLEYDVHVQNEGMLALGNVLVLDPLPSALTYVPNSTTVNGVASPDNPVPPFATAFPLDESGLLLESIPVGGYSDVKYRVLVNQGATSLTNAAIAATENTPSNTAPVITNTVLVTPPANMVACQLNFTDGSGNPVSSFIQGGSIYVTLTDSAQNTSSTSVQTVVVAVTNLSNGDIELLNLTETGNNTGVFRNTSALLSANASLAKFDGTLQAATGNSLQTYYTDTTSGSFCSASASVSSGALPVVYKFAQLTNDLNSNGKIDWGDTVLYRIRITNNTGADITGATLKDTLPSNVSYVANSSSYSNNASAPTAIADSGTTPFPFDESGYALTRITNNNYVDIRFRVTVNSGSILSNYAVVTLSGGQTVDAQQVTNVVAPAASCTLNFSDGSGTTKTIYNPNDSIYVTLSDSSQNTDSGSQQTVLVLVTNTANGDQELITLTETGNNTGVFRNTSALPSSTTTGSAAMDGTLYVQSGNTLQVSVTGPQSETCSASATVAMFTQTKKLYLSDPSQALDRVDPVATGDNTTAQTTTLESWYSSSWPYRKAITIDYTKVSTADQTDFPVLIRLTDSDLSARARSDGYDILFTSSDGVTKLAHEREVYTNSTGALVAWVKVPTLSHTANTILYMYYGNSSATDQQSKTAVWDSNFKSVWHLTESSGTTFYDSTSSANNATGQGTTLPTNAFSGEIGYSVGLNGTTAYLSTTTSYPNPNPYTISVWFRTSSTAGHKIIGLENTQTGTTAANYDRMLYVNTSGKLAGGMYDNQAGTRVIITQSSGTVNDNNWHCGVLSFNNTTLTCYLDGASIGTATVNQSQTYSSGWWRLGSYALPTTWTGGNNGYFAGSIDEARFSINARSASWIATEYNNVSSPSAFYSVGTQEQGQNTATFSLAPSMCSGFVLPSGSQVSLVTYVLNIVGTMPSSPSVTATLKKGTTYAGATTIASSSAATYASGNGTLSWTLPALGSDVTVNAGDYIYLDILTTQSGVSFQVAYDSSTAPSAISLPTTTVITLDSIGIYTAPYPSSNQTNAPFNGQTLYVRVTASDPFGTNDVNHLSLSMVDPNAAATTITLAETNVVNVSSCSKTYEYVWFTGSVQGSYNVAATAYEGTEGITNAASTIVQISFQDGGGTPSTTRFTEGNNGNPTNAYTVGNQVCVWVQDQNRNTSSTTSQTVQVTITTTTGDQEPLILTETGVNTGIFTACIGTANTTVVTNDGTLNVTEGTGLTVTYTDPTDANDTSSDTAIMKSSSLTAVVSVNKTLVTPASGNVLVGGAVQFDIRVSNPGTVSLANVGLTDTFPSSLLTYSSASVTPDSTGSGTLTWNNIGPMMALSNRTISVYFTANAAGTVDNQATVTGSAPTVSSHAYETNTNPHLTLGKYVKSPASGPAYIGQQVIFTLAVTNTGNTTITTLPVQDEYSTCFQYATATNAPNGSGGGLLLWNNVGPLAPNAYWTNDVVFNVIGSCNPAANVADVSYAVDANGFSVPPVQKTASIVLLGASIGTNVYYDVNNSSNWDSGDKPLSGVIVYIDSNGNGVRDGNELFATTDTNGWYQINNLAAGTYTVRVDTNTLPSYMTPRSDLDFTNTPNVVSGVVLTPGQVRTDLSFGYIAAIVQGNVFIDKNSNGTYESGTDTNLPSVQLQITDVNGAVYTVMTDSSGHYSQMVPPGLTQVKVVSSTVPAGAVLATGNSESKSVTVPAGGNPTANFGYTYPPSIGGIQGTIYMDNPTANGAYNSGTDTVLANVQVGITNTSGGAVLYVTTDANGFYSATVAAGTYNVGVVSGTMPAGVTLSGANGNSKTVTANATNTTDLGWTLPGGTSLVQGLVYADNNGNGQYDTGDTGLANVVVQVKDTNGVIHSVTTDSQGRFSQEVPAGVTVVTVASGIAANMTLTANTHGQGQNPVVVTAPSGGAVSTFTGYMDPLAFGTIAGTIYTDVNNDGIYTPGTDIVLPGVQVQITTSESGVYTVTTDSNGHYTQDVPVGSTTVQVLTGGLPTGSLLATNNVNPQTATVYASQTTVVNSGYVQPASMVAIGNLVFGDVNANGLYDGGDSVLSGVGVQLYTNGATAGSTTPLRVGVTDANGLYYFDNLLPGSYFIWIAATNFQAGGPLLGKISSSGVKSASTDNADKGVDASGPAVTGISSAVSAFAVGTAPTGESSTSYPGTVPDANNNFTMDFGFVQSVSMSGTVWHDVPGTGVYAGGDYGIAGVTITLTSNGVTVATTTTASDGTYSFANLQPGTYVITETDPSGFISSGDVYGANDNQITVTLSPGGSSTGRDLLDRWPRISGTVFDDANGLTDSTVNGTGTSVSGALHANLLNGSGNVVATVALASDGTYTFTDVPSATYTVQVTVNTGTVGNPAPATALPANWVNTGEHLGAGSGNDGSVDGSLAVTVSGADVSAANFGIEQLPTTGSSTATSQVNPGGTTSVTVPAAQFSGTDADGTVANLKITSFPTYVTSITINGTTYTSGTFPGGGVTVPVNGSGQPTQVISVDPVDGAVSVVISYVEIDNAGQASASGGTVTLPFTTVSVSGTVYDDANGLTDSLVNGTGTSAGSTLYANLVDGSGNVVAATVVAGNGTYSFSGVNGGSYTVVLSTTQGTPGDAAPAASLPANWVNTGEGTNPAGDGTVNGVTPITVTTASVTGVNFGIDQRPDSNPASASYVNPGGTATVQVPALTGSDPEEGVLGGGNTNAVVISTLPGNATLYYNGTAVTVGQVITSYDPTKLTVDPTFEGSGTVTFTFAFKDAAGQVDQTPATATLTFTGVNLSGNVFDDANGLSDLTVNGTGTSLSGALHANLVTSGNVVATVAVGNDGTYSFNNISSGNYTVQVSVNAGTESQPMPATALPAGWVNSGENLGSGAGNDGTPNGLLTVTVASASVNNANFGVAQEVAIGDFVWLDLNNNGVQDAGEPGLGGVTVALYREVGGVESLFTTTNTSANGSYLFTNLPPGDYQLQFTAPSGGYTRSPALQGGNPAKDSNPNATTGRTATFTLAGGGTDLSQDAGFVANPTAVAGAWLGAYVDQGQVWVIWHTYSEGGLLGFDVYRSAAGGPEQLVTLSPAFASGLVLGQRYTLPDFGARLPGDFAYRLTAYCDDGRVRELARTSVHLAADASASTVRITGIESTAGQVLLRWSGGVPSYVVEEADSLGIGAVWRAVGPAQPGDTQWVVPVEGNLKFYRVRSTAN